MALPPPVPAAGLDIPPPIFNFVAIDLRTGMYTVQAISQLTQFWAFVVGNDGLDQRVVIIENLHGDGTLSPTGLLIVTKTNGTPFGPFATGTDGADLTDGSTPYAKLVDLAGASLLGADAAGPVDVITIGRGLLLAAGVLSQQDPVVAVAGLGAPTAGKRAFVNDSTVAAAGNFGAIVAGGAGFFVPCFADGVNWLIG